MHRLLVDSDLLIQNFPMLPKEAKNHLKVIRPREGEVFELFDGYGLARSYVWTGGTLQAQSTVRVFVRRSVPLTLFACITKGSRWDWTIEKATELGVARIVPVISDRTIVRILPAERAAKRDRWLRIAEDAARQSDAKWLPEITEAVNFKDALSLVKETTCFVGALTTPPSPPLMKAIQGHRQSDKQGFSTFIGPEGDFTPEELSALLKIAIPTSFGPTVLRAETAAVFALSVLAGACA